MSYSKRRRPSAEKEPLQKFRSRIAAAISLAPTQTQPKAKQKHFLAMRIGMTRDDLLHSSHGESPREPWLHTATWQVRPMRGIVSADFFDHRLYRYVEIREADGTYF